MESFPMDTNDAANMTQTQHISQVHTEFLPEKDIPTDGVLREDYEKLRITYELQRDIGNPVLPHRKSFDTKPKRPGSIFFAIRIGG